MADRPKLRLVTIQQVYDTYSKTEERVLEEYKKKGLPIPTRPNEPGSHTPFDPLLPEDLTTLTNGALGQTHTVFTSYAAWVLFEAATADNKLTTAKNIRDTLWALLRFQKEGTDVDRADQTRVDPEYLKADGAVQAAQYRHNLVGAVVGKINKDLRVLSRELTRRGMLYEHEERNDSIEHAKQGMRLAGLRRSRLRADRELPA
jgi:hypothetical protein